MRKKQVFFILSMITMISGSTTFCQQRETKPVELKKISENLYEILGGSGANGGVYIGENGVLVIDAKMDQASVEQTIAEIKKLTSKPITHLVDTHSDGDHINGNRYFPPKITFIAHENCRKDFFLPGRNNQPSQWEKPELAPFVPSVTFRDKMDVHLGSKKVELYYFGVGHTTGDGVVYFPEEKAAFIGDQIFATKPQLIHSYKGGNSFEHVKTLTKMLATLDADRFFSGHSEEVDRAFVNNHLKKMKAMQAKVKELIKSGKSLEEVKSVFNENEARLITSVFNEIKMDN